MSKVDAQRAMREAKYAARNSTGAPARRAAATAAAPSTPAAATPPKPTRAAKAAPSAGAAAPVAASEGQRCGHKSINGRECTREAGHPEKNHRYS